MIDLLNLLLQLCRLMIRHPIDDKQGIGTFTKIFQEDILSLHGINIIRKIIQDIIIHPGINITDAGRYEQDQTDDQNNDPVFCNRPAERSHI